VRLDWSAVLPGHRGMVTACPVLVLRRRGGVPALHRHLFHDEGAFKLGLAAGLLAAVLGRSGLAAGLWAGAVGASAHALSHWIDADLGGSSTAAALLTVLAAALAAGLVLAETRPMQPGHESPPDDAGRRNSILRAT
jgi:hypothetical protein